MQTLIAALVFAQADASPSPSAAPPAPHAETIDDVLTRSQLSGDWWGARSGLSAQGITFDIDLVNFFQGVAAGGLRRDFAVGGNFNLELNADLGVMKLVPGGSVFVHGESRYGETVNADTGALTPVNTRGYFPLTTPSEASVPFAVTELSYSQTLFEIVSVTIGKMVVVDGDSLEFAGGRGRTQFFNSNFVYNAVTSQTAPYATLGASIEVQPVSWLNLSTAVFGTNDASTTSGFADLDNGLTWWGQLAVQYDLGTLPGGCDVGGLYAFDNDFAQVGGTVTIVPGGFELDTVSDSWAVFAGMWQYLYTPDTKHDQVNPSDTLADLRGVGVFARLGFADPDANPVDWSASIGLGGRGLIPGRDDDTCGLAYYRTEVQNLRLQSILPIASWTQGVEAYYDIAITPAVNLTFDAQWIDGVVTNVDPALVLGMRLDVAF